MIQKLKPASGIPGVTPLSTDSTLYSAFVTRNAVPVKFKPNADNVLTIELYSFENIEDNVQFESDVNSKVVQASFTSDTGTITVTSKSGDVSVYDYVINVIPLTAALPLITTLADDDNHVLQYIQNIKPTVIANATFNIGVVTAKIGVPFTGTGIVVQAGSYEVFSSSENPDGFLPNEKAILFNDVDKYIVVRNTSVITSTENSIFLKVIEAADYILEEAPTGIIDENEQFYDKIGYRIGQYFIPITEISILRRSALYAINADIPAICSSYNIPYLDTYSFISFDDFIDSTYIIEEQLLSWNLLSADKGFTAVDISKLSNVFSIRILDILSDSFYTYTENLTTEDNRTFEVRYKEWLEFNNIYDVYVYCKTITEHALETTNLAQQQENDIKRAKFVKQFTASFINDYFTATDLLYFINRLTYFNSIVLINDVAVGRSVVVASLNVLNVLYSIKTTSNSDNATIAYITEVSAKLFAENFHKFKHNII